MEDGAAAALGAPVNMTRTVLQRGARRSRGRPRRRRRAGTQERHGADRERDRGRPVAAAAAELMKVLDVDAIKTARATRDIGDTSFGNDTAARRRARRRRGKRGPRCAPRGEARTAEAALAKGDAAAAGPLCYLWMNGWTRQVDRGRRPFTRASPACAAGRASPCAASAPGSTPAKKGRAAAADVAALRELRRDLGGPRLGARAAAETRSSTTPERRGRYLTEVRRRG